jgi:hypothetical protein
MHEAIEGGPMGRQIGEELADLFIAAHVAVENQRRVKICCEFGDAVFETFPHIAERQLGTLFMACFGNPVGNRTIR